MKRLELMVNHTMVPLELAVLAKTVLKVRLP